MRRNIGTYTDPSAALLGIVALLSAAKNHKPKPPTPEQIAAAEKRAERQRWNDAVEAKKQAKLAAKEPT